MASWMNNSILRAGIVVLTFGSQAFAATTPNLRLAASPGYRYRDVCPFTCSQSGASSGNWSLYHNLAQTASCDEPVWYDFTFIDPVDDTNQPHRIYACTNPGSGWGPAGENVTSDDLGSYSNKTTAMYEFGYWPNANGSSVVAGLNTLNTQLQHYIANGFAPTNRTTVLYASAGTTSLGVYIGKGLDSKTIGSSALTYLQNATLSSNFNYTGALAMQLCGENSTGDHIFGLIATGNSSFGAVQEALSSWSNASCLSISETNNFTAPVVFTTPVIHPNNGTSNFTSNANSTSSSHGLSRRSDCSTAQVVSGDSCGSLAQKCGISGSQFTSYNPDSNFCSSLTPGQHVCCSAGSLPDFAPKPNSDGECATYTVAANDNCANLAAQYSITMNDIENFNKDTWAWNGCSLLYVGTIICLSTGTPPMPAALANAVCGPQKPGTTTPPQGTDISTLNPCPLNACCDVWGQCGVTGEFCTNSSTGAPGTAKPGTNGCISNCGTNIVLSSPPTEYRNVAFFEGYNLGRPCLYQDASQIDTSVYSHVFFSFGTLDTNYTVQVGNTESTFEFNQFLLISGAKRILSIGGWAFSTDPSTYTIFRNGVTEANRQTMATNIANFVKSNGLDGVNIDWEYPGAPDIPGIPADSPDSGENYLAFLTDLRELIPDQELSIAAPSSYWYLRGFPIQEMSEVLDYIIYMTYDLHGQWDANNQWSQEGCPTGTCLRSDVNLTETIGSLVMITKAGVPSNQVIVGVTSYGRSFAMADAGCYGPTCTYLGSAGDSQATPGECTQTAGYIANAEINAIIANSSRVNQNFVDSTSNSNILVYDNTQWVGYMSDDIKASRSAIYKDLAMGGVTDWASDLAKFNDPPPRATSWAEFLARVKAGQDPADVGARHGNWTEIPCTDPAETDGRDLTSQERWDELDCVDAWSDALANWAYDLTHDSYIFSQSLADTWHFPTTVDCGQIGDDSGCNSQQCNQYAGTGPAGSEVWNSLVEIHDMYDNFWNAINGEAGTELSASLASFENTFAPIPPPKQIPEWEEVLIAVLQLGTSIFAAPFFNSIFKKLPWGKANPNSLGVIKDDTSGLITFGGNIAKDTITPGNQDQWTPADQSSFSAYLGSAVKGWTAIIANTLEALFKGDQASIAMLSTLIQNGTFMAGSGGIPDLDPDGDTITDLENSVAKAFYAFAIPGVWKAAGSAPFVVTVSDPCDPGGEPLIPSSDPIYNYLTQAAVADYGCANGILYFLAYPPDGKKLFDALPGTSSLATSETDYSTWGGVTVSDIVLGSVNTYVANGNQNSAPYADPTNAQTISDLINSDITTPGVMRLPVCSAATAMAAWTNPSRVNASDPDYPCVPLQGVTDCQNYQIIDDTSATDSSPLISDCQDIITNIQGTSGTWTTTLSRTRQLVQAGTCALSVTETTDEDNGNASYTVGSQDIINIINMLIQAEQGVAPSGRIQGGGTFDCHGNIKTQPNVGWHVSLDANIFKYHC